MNHVFDRLREVCLACGQTRMHHDPECHGIIKYREWLRGLVWTQEPIIPDTFESNK